MTLFMETTKIPAARTAAEITALLAGTGASQVVTTYGPRGEIAGLRWTMERNGQTVGYDLPLRIESIFQIFQNRRRRIRGDTATTDREQAQRVAWRQLLRWIQAQVALIQTGMVETEEVFLPYMLVSPDQTLFARIKEGGLKALPAPRRRP